MNCWDTPAEARQKARVPESLRKRTTNGFGDEGRGWYIAERRAKDKSPEDTEKGNCALLLHIADQHHVRVGVPADEHEFTSVGGPVIVPDMLSLEGCDLLAC